MLADVLGHLRQKNTKFTVRSWIEWPCFTFSNAPQCSRQLQLRKVGVQQQGRGASQCCRNFTDSCFREQTRNRVRYYIHLTDLWYIRTYFWKAIAPQPSNGGTPNLELRVCRVCSIDRRPHPLPVIYAYGASASDYTCRPNIHYLLYWLVASLPGRVSNPLYCFRILIVS